MDLERLQFRAQILQKIRNFFIEKQYIEVDTPALSTDLIPETCLEVFKTDYIEPWSGKIRPLYLVPSPEIYIKKIIAQHKVSVFQLSKCYRNVESVGRIHSPEFTMLEYYTVGSDYKDTATLTEELFEYLLPPPISQQQDPFQDLRPPFIRLTMEEAFVQYAGFSLAQNQSSYQLAEQARRLGIMEQQDTPFDTWQWDDLYELIFVQTVEPQLPRHKPVFLMDYPAQVPCLAQDVPPSLQPKTPTSQENSVMWKQRWELYARGMELSNCYSEETDPQKIKAYFEREGALKNRTARVPHKIDETYWENFKDFPACSGNAMGIDRLIALLAGQSSIETVLPFTLNS